MLYVTNWHKQTFYMLQSILVRKMALAAYLADKNTKPVGDGQEEGAGFVIHWGNPGTLKGNGDAVHCDTTHLNATEVLGETSRWQGYPHNEARDNNTYEVQICWDRAKSTPGDSHNTPPMFQLG